MYNAIYPVIGHQKSFPFYLSGIGVSSPEFHIVRETGLVSDQILFTLYGEGIIEIDGHSYPQQKGSVFYVASGVPHEYYPTDGKWTTCWVVFRGDYLRQLMDNMGFPRYICQKVNSIDKLKDMFDMLLASAQEAVYGEEKSSMLLYDYIIAARRQLLFRNDGDKDSIIAIAVAFMDKNFRRDISLRELSEVCHISKQYFCKLFRERMGMRPLEYLAQRRILEAKILLYSTDRGVAEIGQEVGYKDSAYFGMVFKKYEGISPSRYRKLKKL